MSDIQPASLPLYAGWVVPGTTAAEQRAYIERLICQRSGDVVVAWLASEVERLRDALVQEHERLQERINLLFDKIEAQLRQSLKATESATPTADAQLVASVLVAFMQGRLQRFARTGFKRLPSEHLQAALGRML